MEWLNRLRAWLPRRLSEQELDDEFRFHIESRATALTGEGVPLQEALRRARLEFGAAERRKEECRDERSGAFARQLMADLRSTWRHACRDPGLNVTILGTMSLAIAVTATIFAVVNAVIFEAVPYREPDRVVMLWNTNARIGVGLDQARRTGASVSAADFVLWRDDSGLFEALAAVAVTGGAHLGGATRLTFVDADANAEPARVALVSSAFFEVTGVRPRIGQPFGLNERHDSKPAAWQTAAVILQDAYWRSRFDARPDVVGQTVWQDYGAGEAWSRELLVTGVMPREFAIVSRGVDYLQPFDIDSRAAQFPKSADFVVIGRLRSGLSVEEAQQRASAFAQVLEGRDPERARGWRVQIVPAAQEASGEFRPFVLALLGAVLLLVLVLAVNTTTLLLLRAEARAREIAVRTAVGASPGRLLRQFMTESTVIALSGAVMGVCLAHLLLAWLRVHLPNPKTWGGSFLVAESLRIDGEVVLFAVAVGLLVGAVFGLVPAWHASRTTVVEALKRSGAGLTPGPRQRRLAHGLLAAQFVLAAVLATGSGLLVRSGFALYRQGPGFEHASRLVVGVRAGEAHLKRLIEASGRTPADADQAISASREPYWVAREQFRQAILQRAAALPGVVGVTSSTAALMRGGYWLAGFRRAGGSAEATDPCTEGLFTSVDPNFFGEVRIPLLAGRLFDSHDRGGRSPVVIVSAEVARRCWPGRSALGEKLQSIRHPEQPWFTVIGVVGDTRSDGMDKPPVPHVYEPWSQNRWWHGATNLVLRTRGDPLTVVTPLRHAMSQIDEDAYILGLHRLEDLVDDSAWRLTYAARLSVSLALVSLLLAAIGIYGVLSHTVRQRTPEIGLRMALGARARHLAGFVLRHAMVGTGLGVVVGLIVSGVLMTFLRALLFGVEPVDSFTFVGAAVVLTGTALVAAALPLRRALRLEPLEALRRE